MEGLAKFVDAIAALLWPLFAICFTLGFRKEIAKRIENISELTIGNSKVVFDRSDPKEVRVKRLEELDEIQQTTSSEDLTGPTTEAQSAIQDANPNWGEVLEQIAAFENKVIDALHQDQKFSLGNIETQISIKAKYKREQLDAFVEFDDCLILIEIRGTPHQQGLRAAQSKLIKVERLLKSARSLRKPIMLLMIVPEEADVGDSLGKVGILKFSAHRDQFVNRPEVLRFLGCDGNE